MSEISSNQSLNKILDQNPKHAISYYLLSTIISDEEDIYLVNKILNINTNNFNTNYVI